MIRRENDYLKNNKINQSLNDDKFRPHPISLQPRDLTIPTERAFDNILGVG